MTAATTSRECPFAVAFDHMRPGPWTAQTREFKSRRQRCASQRAIQYQTFSRLAETWRKETWYRSPIKSRMMHPAYLQIIGLGPIAVPWILEELKRTPDHWFAALEAITREDPAPNARSMGELRDAWLAWGEGIGR